MRGIKFNIIQNETDYPLTWEDQMIDFDTEEEAREFAALANIDLSTDAYIKESIYFYDGGYITGTEATRLYREEYGLNG